MLKTLAQALQSGSVRVVDLSQTLHARTPIIPLPPQYGQSAPFRLDEISNFDERGPAWYWNNISCGEHTGTHFDAPIHWITGKDYPNNTTETIDVQKLVAPACVIDVSAEARDNPDYLLTIEARRAMGSRARPHRAGQLGADAHGLVAARRSRRLSQPARRRRTHAGRPSRSAGLPGARARRGGLGHRRRGHRRRPGPCLHAALSCHSVMHGNNRYGLASLVNLDQLPPTGAILITPPLKIRRGSGSPCRVLALVET